MEPILPHSVPSAASAARSPAEQGEKTGSADTAHSGEHRFESILKRTAAGKDDPAEDQPTAHGDRRAASAGKKAKADPSDPPSVSAAVWGSVAPTAPEESLPAAGGAASDPKDSGSSKTGSVPVLAGGTARPAEGDPLLKQLSSEIDPAPTHGEENAAPAQAPKAGGPGAAPAPPTAAASESKGAGSAKGDPAVVLAAAGTLPVEGGLIPKPLSSGKDPAAADGEENAAPAQAPKAGGSGTVSVPPPAAASDPKNAGSARVDGIPALVGNTDPAPGGTAGVEGARKKKDDASVRIEGKVETAATHSADGNPGVAEKAAPPRPVGPAPDPGIVRFEEKAFVITRKSDTSVEVTLAPPGVGKLEIEVVLEKGIINARILAADSAGREAITRSLPQIVEALARDGMNVGGFTVSLKERRDREGGSPGHGALRDPGLRPLSAVTLAASASAASAGLVDIFV